MEQLPCDVVLCGGVLGAKGEVLSGTLRKAIAEGAPQARVVQSRYEAIVGACALALEADGISVSGEVAERLYGPAERQRLVRG